MGKQALAELMSCLGPTGRELSAVRSNDSHSMGCGYDKGNKCLVLSRKTPRNNGHITWVREKGELGKDGKAQSSGWVLF